MTANHLKSHSRKHVADRRETIAGIPEPVQSRVDLLTTSEVAELLRRTPRTIRNWVKGGRLRPVDLPGPLLFRRQALELLFGHDTSSE